MTNLVEFRGLDFRTPRGRVHALRDVSFDVPRGRILGIVGESGSGKSTAVWALLRLLAPNAVVTGGAVVFDGRDVLGFGEAELRRFRGEQVSVVFQNPMTAQIPVLSYGRQMQDILYRRRAGAAEKRRRAVEMMRRVGIADPELRISQYPHHFSGGMRQRAGIAMALLMEPALLVADEPTTALDVTMEAQIMHLMRRLQAEMQATLVVVSHNLGLVAELCDEVVVLYAGEVVEKGDIRQIFHHARHPYTRALLECDPARILERAHRLPTIPGELPDLRSPPKGCVFAPRCPKVMPVCRGTEPLHHRAGEGHRAKCHLLHPDHGDPGWPPPLTESVFPSGNEPTAPPRSTETVLAVEDLGVRFRTGSRLRGLLRPREATHVDAVLGASLALARGEALGIVGESGSGKTTLARAVLGLARAQVGSVAIEGREVLGLGQAGWKPVGARRP
jgi:peptide/nickel transport system ATP-binding protein